VAVFPVLEDPGVLMSPQEVLDRLEAELEIGEE
jgi:hypothetical protein